MKSNKAVILLALLLSFTITSCEDSSTSSVTEDLDQSFANQEKPEDFIVDEETYNDFHKVDENKIIRKLDILFVPDTSSSIKEERKAIADGFHNFFNSLPTNIDTNIGVVLAHGPKSNKSGKLHQHNNEPVVLKTSELSLEKIKEYLSLKIHKPREDGSSDGGEMGMYSLQEALNSENIQDLKAQGLLREDAALVIVFAADEQDICAKAPEGITLKEDQQNAERKTFVNTCIEEDMHWKDVIVGGNYTYKITPEGVFNKIKAAHPNGRILISGVIYNENSVIPAGNEDEIGYGYKDLIELSGGVSIDLASGDYSKGLAAMARLASVKEEDIIKSITMKTPYTDPASIVVTLDGVVYENWSFNKETQTITFGEDKDPLAVIGVSYKNDTTKPEFQNFPELGQYINSSSLALNFSVFDEYLQYVSIVVNGSEVYNNESIDISADLSLIEGNNIISIEARDKAGNVSYKTFEIISDTIAPELANLDPENNTFVSTLSFDISASANESLRRATLDGEELALIDNISFSKAISKMSEGQYSFELLIEDLAGNIKSYTLNYEIILKLIRIELVSILPLEDGRLCIKGQVGAARPGIDVNVEGSLFNKGVDTVAQDGSFRVDLNFQNSFQVSASDAELDRSESYTIEFKADTTLSGVIKDIDDTPIPGVTVTLVNSGQSTTTNGDGVFSIADPMTGDQELAIDGTTVPVEYTQEQKAYSQTLYNVSISNLDRNVIDKPIYLVPKLLDGTQTIIASGEGATVTSPHAPGVSLTIPADTAIFPEGEEEFSINIIEIPADKVTVETPEQVKPSTVFAFEPSGLKFTERVPLELPNVDELPEGTQMVILSKNSETGFWEGDGSAEVVGGKVVTREGQGISHFSELIAVPMGMEIKKFGKENRPGINTFDGEMSRSIALPSFKVRGSDFTPSLMYRSNWAYPRAVVENVFDIPKSRMEFPSVGGGSVSGANGGRKEKYEFESWITPEWIDSYFYTGEVTSGKVRYNGPPNKSVVAYAVDLSSEESGVYPALSTYELKLKRTTLTTRTIKKRSFGGRTRKKKKRYYDTQLLDSIFPPELRTNIYHSNKVQSEYGQGWKLSAVSEILNPAGTRIAIEGGDGNIIPYVLTNTLETVAYDENGIKAFKMQGEDILYSSKGDLFLHNIQSDSKSLELDTQDYVTQLGLNSLTYNKKRSGTRKHQYYCEKAQYCNV